MTWRSVEPLLDRKQRARLLRAEREHRMRPHGSKYWVAGYPELVAQWHPTKNEGVWPDEVRFGARRRLWWKCAEGPDHEWQVSAHARVGGSTRGLSRCPFCLNLRVSVTNSLASRAPGVAREWHPTRNGALRPRDVPYTSNRKHWWKCPKEPDHEWRTPTRDRTRRKRVGCPYCANQAVSVTNALAARSPRIAREWHPTKNGRLTPDDVVASSQRKAWWQCRKDARHVWKGVIRDRTQRTKGCPFCSHRRIWSDITLAARDPRVARQWHPTKNRALTPRDVMAGSARAVWWKCPAGPDHVWRARVCFRTRAAKPVGCPFCSGLRGSTTNSLAALAPAVARQWHPKKNGTMRPSDVTLGSSRRVWWKCRLGPDHEWCSSPRTRTSSGIAGRCPFCTGRHPSVTNSLAARAPAIARQWHPTRNGALRPTEVTTGSGKNVWWRCGKRRGHVWQAEVKARTGSTFPGRCPLCAGVRAPGGVKRTVLRVTRAKASRP
ncbi:MAG TPA: zinc-ribbon domain-containing protein [Polyangiaceae bacterium]